MPVTKQEVLDCHRMGRPGKIEVVVTRPSLTRRDLTLAYSPGVAEATLSGARPGDRIRTILRDGIACAFLA
jgi:malate dehydrogenase (oxaloacetate-decarboxylating)(NADP+)